MDMKYPFYDIYDDKLPVHISQGDVFSKKMITFNVKNPKTIRGYIILNATCDIVRSGKVDYLMFSPIRPFRYYLEQNRDHPKLDNFIDTICKYNTRKAFFLPSSDKIGDGKEHYVELGYVVSISVGPHFERTCEGMKKFRKVTLKSPWKEKLGDMVGDNFSRVGVPDIDKKHFKKWRDQQKDFSKLKYLE